MKAVKALLDTHVLLHWISGSTLLSKKHGEVIQAANAVDPLWVSDITLWEIATLESLGRIELDLACVEVVKQVRVRWRACEQPAVFERLEAVVARAITPVFCS